jgi:phage tail-like protein
MTDSNHFAHWDDNARDYDPAPAFYFRVVFDGATGSVSASPADNSFMEVDGLTPSIDTESVEEGGENRFVHELPKGVKYSKLSLKRGIAGLNSPLVDWCKQVLESGFIDLIQPKDLSIRLLDRKGDPLRTWDVINAYPVRWQVEKFDSMNNAIAVEKIEMSYNYAHRTR